MVTTLIVVGAIVIVAGIFIVRTINKEQTALLLGPARHTSTPLLPPTMKRQIEETETEIRKKAETVANIIAKRTGEEAAKKKKTEVSRDPLNETSFMRLISDKVEKVKRISGVE